MNYLEDTKRDQFNIKQPVNLEFVQLQILKTNENLSDADG
jgi:hypothetical protein